MRTQQMKKTTLCGLLIGVFLNLPVSVSAEDGDKTEQPSDGYTDAEIAEMINNPLSSLWLMFSQNDTVWYEGDLTDRLDEDDKVFNTLLLNPVMPMQITENYKWIFRPALPINSFDTPSASGPPPRVSWDRETGLGDIVLFNAFTNDEGAKPPNVFGAGFTAMDFPRFSGHA